MLTTEPSPESRATGSGQANERALLSQVADGDAAALEELYHRYHRRLARFLMRLTSRYDVAEEVINDTFYVIWDRARDFRGASEVSTWIFGIAYRRALKTLRGSHPTTQLDAVENEPLGDPTQDIELSEWLGVALARLPVEQRVTLELAYHLGHSCEEIATIMDCPPNTVKTRMFHARRKLRTLLSALAGSL